MNDEFDPPPPRQYALVRLTDETRKWLTDKGHTDSPLLRHRVFIYLGEIPNMPDHCIVVGHPDGEVLSGYHIGDFEEVPDDET